MHSLLIDTGDCPITVEQIRSAMGLDTDRFDALISCEITSACIAAIMRNPPRVLRRETWMVDPDRVDAFGEPAKVGPVEYWIGVPVRRCVYEADTSLLPAARQQIVRRMLRHDDVDLYLTRNHPAVRDELLAPDAARHSRTSMMEDLS